MGAQPDGLQRFECMGHDERPPPPLPPTPMPTPPACSEDYLNPFPAHPSGRGVCDEYAPALRAICVAPELLASSPLHERLAGLARAPAPPAEVVLAALLRAAFALPSDEAARAHTAAMPLFELPAPTRLFDACGSFVRGLRWEGPALRSALAQLLVTETADGAACLVGLMAQASTSCASRRRAALCSVLARLPAAAVAAAAAPLPPSRGVPRALAPAAARLAEVAAALIHDVKDKAFDTVFVQPMRAAAELAGLAYVKLDGDVHGAPTLAAVLLAATGVRVSRVPELDDEATGFADGAVALAEESLAALWAPAALGRPFEGVRGAARLRTGAAPRADVFCGWRGSRLDGSVPTVRAFAARVGVPSAAGARSRERLGAYLIKFAEHLSEEALLPRLAAALLAAPGGDLAALLPAARAAAGEAPLVPPEGCGGGGGGGGDGGENGGGGAGDGDGGAQAAAWLWDMDVFPPTLHVPRTRALLRLLGVLKVGASAEEWACAACTLLNPAHATVCEACDA
jgi:hypothetical protein